MTNLFELPPSFKPLNDDYITSYSMRKFLKANSLKLTGTVNEQLDVINKFANKNKNNSKLAHKWLDNTLKEGIKDIYIFRLKEELNYDIKNIEKKINELIDKNSNNHVILGEKTYDFQIKKYEIHNNNVSIWVTKLLKLYDNKKDSASDVLYPLYIDIDIEKKYLIIRGKPKQKLYNSVGNRFVKEDEYKTNLKKEVFKLKNWLLKIFNLEVENKNDSLIFFKKRLFNMLKKYSETPLEIKKIIDDNQGEIIEIKEKFINIISNNLLTGDYETMLIDDLNNILEKYISITYDESIFIKNKQAYPYILKATDDELSIYEQDSGDRETSIQSKSIFYDTKQTLFTNKECDNANFMYSNGREGYNRVTISVKDNFCLFKFYQYTDEEVIINVIREII